MIDFVKISQQLHSSDQAVQKQARTAVIDFWTSLTRLKSKCNAPGVRNESINQEANNQLEVLRRSFPFKQLYKAIDQPYQDDLDNPYKNTPIRHYLLSLLWDIHEEDTLIFISRLFPNLPPAPEIQFSALRVLSAINTVESLRLLARLLVRYKSEVESKAYVILVPLFKDSSKIKALLPEILGVLDNSKFRLVLLELFQFARQKGDLKHDDFTNGDFTLAKPGLVEDLKNEHRRRIKLSKNGDSYRRSSDMIGLILDFLGSFRNDGDTTGLVNQFVDDVDPYVSMSAIIALFSKGQIPDSKCISRVAADPTTRIYLFNGLERLGKTQYFPREYYSQEQFAEGAMVNWLSHGMEMGKPPHKIQLLGKLAVEISNRQQNLYIYKFLYDKKGWMVGQSGPQPLDTSTISTDSYLTFSNFEKFDETRVDAQTNNIMETLSEFMSSRKNPQH